MAFTPGEQACKLQVGDVIPSESASALGYGTSTGTITMVRRIGGRVFVQFDAIDPDRCHSRTYIAAQRVDPNG